MNKKGFTLVELLAVIIILIIVLVIAISRVKKTVDNTSDKSIIANASMYIKAIDDAASNIDIRQESPYNDGVLLYEELKNLDIQISGTKPDDGYIIMNNYEVTTACLTYGKYSVKYENNDFQKPSNFSCKFYTPSATSEVYAYKGKTELFVTPQEGTYKLEVWGAQGGDINSSYIGGYGGYSVATIHLKKYELLYVNVGGRGTKSMTEQIAGGFNGGGASHGADCGTYTNRWGGSGGGATSIALVNGQLKDLNEETDKEKILIVAGGGGGAFNISDWQVGSGGHAGGFNGNVGYHTNNNNHGAEQYAQGGTQTSGGRGGEGWEDIATRSEGWHARTSGTFGLGGSSPEWACAEGGGGGGGFYGGGGGSESSGAGGSGYIGNSRLIAKEMYCYSCTASSVDATRTTSTTCANENPTDNCSKKGNGYAKITLVE